MIKRTLVIAAVLIAATTIVFSQSQLDKARLLLTQKNFNEAINVCQNYVMSSPRDEDGWLLLARSHQMAGNLDAAEKAAKKAVELEDDFMEAYAVLAQVQLEKNRWQDAYFTVQTGLKMRGKGEQKHVPLVIVLGWSLLKADSANAALVAGMEARELNPRNATTYEIIGQAYLKQGQAMMAIDNFEKSWAIDTSQTRVLVGLAESYTKARRYTEAAKTYIKIIEREPGNDNARLDFARLLFRANQPAKCVTVLKAYFDDHKNPAKETREMYIEALLLSGRYDDAKKEADELIKTEPNSTAAVRAAANWYYSKQQYGKAVEAFQKLAAVDTLQFDDYKWLGYSYRQIKKDSLAAMAWEEAFKDTNETLSVRSALLGEIGSAWMYAKVYERAAQYFKMRFQFDPTAVSAYINYAQCMMQLNRYDESISALKEAIAKNPKSPSAHVNLGYSYYQLKDYDKSYDEFKAAISVVDTAESRFKNDLADSYRMIGLLIMLEKKNDIESSQKKWESAIVQLKKSLKYKEDAFQTHLLLAKCYQNLGKIEDAIRHYRRVLKLDPGNKEAKAALDELLKKQ